MEKSGKIRSCHCTFMADMGQSCNHDAVAIYRIEAAVRNWLTSPSCTSTANQWLPNHKVITHESYRHELWSLSLLSAREEKRIICVGTNEKI